MNEQILQYLWNAKIFNRFDFKDTEGNALEILDFGTWNKNAGPDFLLAKIKTKHLIFSGNIELHVRSSDWDLHGHSKDKAYQNTILHAVFHHDKEIDFLRKRNIPTLELKEYISADIIKKYSELEMLSNFIPCQKIFTPKAIPIRFEEETLLKKLDQKAHLIEQDLHRFKNNYEAVLFHQIAYSFGLKINAETFKQIAESVDFSIIQKIQQNATQLEALFFGIAGWLDDVSDNYMKTCQREFQFLKAKFQISEMVFQPKFLRLRPPNFPTIRLSQLANFYHRNSGLFSKIIEAQSVKAIQKLFEGIAASEYWESHFNFGKIAKQASEKKLAKSFANLIIINAILPVKYAYLKHHNRDLAMQIVELYRDIPPEKNHITEQMRAMGIEIKNALSSQALIYQYKTFCLQKKCLTCDIGLQLLKP